LANGVVIFLWQKDKQEAGPSRVKSAVPRNYAYWEKFDVGKELLKMELEDERRKEQATKKKKQQQEKEKKKNKRDEEDKVVSAAGMFQ
jgi:alcohol dehydrogenase YqhD (iron-dependent ADH family)